MFAIKVCKIGLQKFCKLLAYDLVSKLGVRRGFQKGITLGDRTTGSFLQNKGLQKRVAKNLLISGI